MKLAICGCGKMGTAIEQQARLRDHEIVARLGPRDALTGDALQGAQVAFEFTRPAAAPDNVRRLLESGASVVCGTTGWEVGQDLDALARSRNVALVVAPNFSLGVQLFYRVVRRAAEVFAAAGLHDAFITEAHHRGKRDAPSGTARRLGAIVLESDPRLTRVQEGNPDGPLASDALPIASVRAGAEPGTHVVGFDGAHDCVTLRHAARGREGFALGAVLAAEWCAGHSGRIEYDELVDRFLAGAARPTTGGTR